VWRLYQSDVSFKQSPIATIHAICRQTPDSGIYAHLHTLSQPQHGPSMFKCSIPRPRAKLCRMSYDQVLAQTRSIKRFLLWTESYNANLLKLTTIYHGLLLKLEHVVGQILQVAYIRFLL
jgi:hypothetical protein